MLFMEELSNFIESQLAFAFITINEIGLIYSLYIYTSRYRSKGGLYQTISLLNRFITI